jgi:exosortase A-associated hydrolase 2
MNALTLTARFEPATLDGVAGPLFAVHYPPRGAMRKHAVLYLPPFAEEMNRARRVAALQARALAEAGIGMLVLDPYGTGDSGGEFADARWETWRSDCQRATDWLASQGYQRISFLGLRLGALLALDATVQSHISLDRVVLWQPVLRGDQMMTQFLRLRLAAELAGGARSGEGTADIRKQLAANKTVEIAGYDLHHHLVAAIDRLKLVDLGIASRAPIDWIDVVTGAGQTVSPAQEQVFARWRQAGRAFAHHTVQAEPFWALQETTLAPALVARTTELLGASR